MKKQLVLWYIPCSKLSFINSVVDPESFWRDHAWVYWFPRKNYKEIVVAIDAKLLERIEKAVVKKFGSRVYVSKSS